MMRLLPTLPEEAKKQVDIQILHEILTLKSSTLHFYN